MSKTYSSDLRERVFTQVNSGLSRREVARRFGVSPSFVVKLMHQAIKSGSTAPSKRGRPPGRGKLAAVMGALVARVEAVPDATLAELTAWLAEQHNVHVHLFSVSRALQVAGFTYKKIAAGGGGWARPDPSDASYLAGTPSASYAPDPT